MSIQIVIAKYNNIGKPLWDRLTSDQYQDKILFNEVLDADFPLFKFESETAGTVKKRKAGDFAISFTYNSTVLSDNEDTVLNFFRGGTNNYIYWFAINMDGIIFSGDFTSDKILSDFTITNRKFECTVLVKDILYGWGLYANTRDCNFNISSGAVLSFEDYIVTHHLNQLVYDPSHVILPNETLAAKCNDNIKFMSTWYNEIRGVGTPFGVFTDWSLVSRLETWEGLARGLGFDYDLILNDTLENIYNDLSALNNISLYYNLYIKWKVDIYNTEPYTLTQSSTHKEYIIPVNREYIFLGYRHHLYPDLSYFTIINGILYKKDNIKDTDTKDNSAITKPFFHIDTDYPAILHYAPVSGNVSENYIRATEVSEIDLPLYACNGFSMGANYLQAGSIAYARLFCNPDTLDFTNVQRFAIKNYYRYSSTHGLKGKELELPFADVPGIHLYSPVELNDNSGLAKYEIDQIDAINIKNKTITVKAVQLPEPN